MSNLNVSDSDFNQALTDLYVAKNYEACMEMSKEILCADPTNLQALIYMANISLEYKDLEDAIHYCDTIINAKEDKIYFVWQVRGQALCLLKRYEEARESFGTALGLMSPESKQEGIYLWSIYALTIFMDGDKERAFNLLDALEEKLDWHGKFSLIRGFIERADGNTDEALFQFIQGSMAIDPTSKDYKESREVFAHEVHKTLETNAGE